MDEMRERVLARVRAARESSHILRGLDARTRQQALVAMARQLRERGREVLDANARDLGRARETGRAPAFLDRLALDPGRIEAMARSLDEVASLPDPVGEVPRMWTRPNGLQIGEVRVPIGVIAIIYEARPNVTSEAASLCLKSGNVCILKGGSDAIDSNRALAGILAEAGTAAGLPAGSLTFIDEVSREAVDVMLDQDELIDLVIPRGGESLIRLVVSKSRIPVIKQYKGVCHTYVDEGADHAMAEAIALNAKVQRPSVCNAMETLLVHRDEAAVFLPAITAAMRAKGVELRGCERCRALVPDMVGATEEDWSTEYLDLVLSVRVVDSLDEAVRHITRYGSGHSEAIVTRDLRRARAFLDRVDAAAVYVNASTRFTDGGQFGMGAEIGISTGKLHSRGPMGLTDLTTRKFIIWGDGQVRE